MMKTTRLGWTAAWLLMVPMMLAAQTSVVNYVEDMTSFPNPERGFFTYTEAIPGSAVLNAATLRQNRASNRTLIWRLYTTPGFRESDFTEAFLNQIRGDLQAMREAGIKCIIRFRYSTAIGSPDAPLAQVLRHIEQLKPVFEEYYDVIAVVNAGFIGAWGEWHSSTNNLTTIANMRAILYALIDAVPERSVQVRYPKAKWDIYGNARATTQAEAFNGSYKSRTGHLNDCFLASSDDVGTYRVSIVEEKKYLNEDVKYTSMTGETCNPQSGWTNYGCTRAMTELAQMRWTALNNDYSRTILNRWVTEGCMPEVDRRLGYRLKLNSGEFADGAKPGSDLSFSVDLTNLGFAAPLNRRGLQVLLRSEQSPSDIWEVNLPHDIRFWLAGDTIRLRHSFRIPADMPAGRYEMFLHLPDPMPTLRNNPDFSIRLANTDVWESATGFNRLGHTVVVGDEQPAAQLGATLTFNRFGTTDIEDVAATTDLPVDAILHDNYPNPFNPSTVIRWQLAQAGAVRLSVLDMLGREVAVLADGMRQAGDHQVHFDATGLPSGVYLYHLRTVRSSITKSMILVK